MELPSDVEELIRAIHGSKTKAVVYATGGAVQSISWLLSVPGASATVLEASVPYSRDSLVEVLGKEPEQYCSAGTAGLIAEAAYRRAAQLCSFGSRIVGVGATCALATVPLKRGNHRVHVAVHDGASCRTVSLTLAKGARSRVGEDDVASRLLVKMLADASGCNSGAFELPLMAEPLTKQQALQGAPAAQQASPTAGEVDVMADSRAGYQDPLQRLLAGEVRCVEYCGDEVVVDAPRRRRVYLPGSFNPLHEGHRELLATGVKAAGGDMEGCFEITVQNADKGLLAETEVRRRVAQFQALGLPVVVTRATLFTHKADLFPDSCFVVGYDTAARLVLPKYYGDSYIQMVLDFARLRGKGCRFVVAGRKDPGTSRFLTLADVDMPPELADLFPAQLALHEDDFRADISSTELRLRQQQQS